jgi:hypothetical protein
MPDTPAKKKGGKKLLGLGTGTWVGIGAGGLGILWYLRKRSAAAAAAAATGTTGGTTIPAADGSSTSSVAAPTTLAEWINDALPMVTTSGYTSTQALNDINDWLAGQCVTQAGYSALGQLVSALGVPPGYTTLPPITVCAGSSSSSSTGTNTTGPGTLGFGTGPGGSGSSAISSDPAVAQAMAYLSGNTPGAAAQEIASTGGLNDATTTPAQLANNQAVQAAQATSQTALLYSSAMSELGLTGAYSALSPQDQARVQAQAAA